MHSWKTTLGGALNAAGLAIVAFTQVETASKWLTLSGLVMAAIGGALTGMTARDNNVTSERAGAK
jgi:hypothetical protein